MKKSLRHAFGMLVVVGMMITGAQGSVGGELKLASLFADDMVLQRDKPVLVRGFADSDATVTVGFADQTKTAKADADGIWSVTLAPMPANTTPQALKVSDATGKSRTVENVLVGDVFLVARQTAIDISLGSTKAGEKAAASHKSSSLFRAISIKTIPTATPQDDLADDVTAGWAVVDKQSASTMNAAAYYIGRDLAATMNVPVGIIDLNLGSAFANSWLSRETLMETDKFYDDREVMSQVSLYDEKLEAEKNGVPFRKQKVPPTNTVYETLFPAGGYNAILHPMRGIALKAVLVQLGNDYPYMIYADIWNGDDPFNRAALNNAYVDTYNIRKVGFRMESKTVPRITREWRQYLGDEDLPFGLIVPPGSDLHTLGQHHREMRELQRLVAEDNSSVGVILPGAENITFSAQPADEPLLAERSLSWILGSVYGRDDIPPAGPLFDRIEPNFNTATIYFKDGTATGLKASGDALDYFEAAGVEGDYSPVKATIDGETITIESDTVNRITRVRYNWNKRPNQNLVNASGLPAIPFRSEREPYHWFVTNADDDLPIEYHTPANEWPQNDVTLINAQLKTHGYQNFTGWIGPAGFRTGPFGPNMGVREVKADSPADGKVFVGDVIYSANGNMLGEKAWAVMAAAITESESRQGKGNLLLGVRRGGKNIDVELQLNVMGNYSPAAPFDCPKTERIINDLESWVVANGAKPGFLNNDALFMLATGNPDLQGYVRRIVYKIISKELKRPINPKRAGKSWHNSAEAILLGEYYMATGDPNVLAHLKHACDRLAATQNEQEGGWRHNYPGGAHYGLIPNAGLPGVMGMYFAKQAGLDINLDSYEFALQHFGHNRAETGFLIYGFGGCERPIPVAFDPEVMAAGKMTSYNGGLSAAGILMEFAGKHRAAHMSSLISAFAWNNTFGGHGGNFWNNFWTPLGAHQHSKKAFINFWNHHRWYRECNRMFDGSLIQHESGKVGAACGVALVAPRERIQIVGAPISPFATNAPAILMPAVELYKHRDYAGCEQAVAELIASGTVGKDAMPTVEYLGRQANDIQASMAADLARMKALCEAGNPSEAKSFVAGLKGVLPAGDARLAEIEKLIAATPEAKSGDNGKTKAAAGAETEAREWIRLVSEIVDTGRKKGNVPEVVSKPATANKWKIMIVEDKVQAPKDWTEPRFDDSDWKETELPISWRMYHTALFRTTFNVDDKKAIDALRLYAWVFRQQGIEIYLNGEIIGKINNIEKKTGNITNVFKESAVKHLRNGENTLAVTTRHNWRWGMLFMRVYNDGFDFNLDARLKN